MKISEQLFQSLVDDDPKAIWVIGQSGETVYSNPAFNILFYEEDSDDDSMRIWDMNDHFVSVWKSLMANGGVNAFTSEISIHGVMAELKVQAYMVKNEDNRNVVFQFIQAATFFQKDSFLQSLIDLFPDAVYYKDLNSRFIMSNKANNEKMKVLHPDVDIIGKTDFDLFSKENAEQAYLEEQEIIATGNSKLHFEKEEVWSDGTITWSANSKMPFYDVGGNIIGTFGIGKDITKEKNKEKQIVQLNLDLDTQVNQLKLMNKELNTFSYSVSHDLRAPLRAINGFSKIILEDHGDSFDKETNRLFKIIIDNSSKMNGLINDLLSYSRLNDQTKRFVSLSPENLVNEVVTELGLDEHLLKINPLPHFFADRVLIKQVFANLIGNAYKFSRNHPSPLVEVGADEKDNHYEFYVKDNGVGFDMAYYDKVFGIFQRLHSDEEFEGTGIGLAIVQKIIHSHHGKIWAESELNHGATFYFSIPKSLEK